MAWVDFKQNDLLIKVEYSSYNHKDYLVLQEKEGSRRQYPHTLGIDAAGTVLESRSSDFKAGDQVAVMATRMGLTFHGGYSEYIFVPTTKVVKIPKNLTPRDLMVFGTAGLTASLALSILMKKPSKFRKMPILITGGSGGVGIISAIMLKVNGFDVTVSTDRDEARNFLKGIGIENFVGRIRNSKTKNFSILPERWSACIDVVGGQSLDLISKSLVERGVILSIGSVAGQITELDLNPFYLRGVSMAGLNSESLDTFARQDLVSQYLTPELMSVLNLATSEHQLDDIPNLFQNSYFNQNFGRHVFKI
jgi:putative YhdH/YhfP family quinone oxidoreductase